MRRFGVILLALFATACVRTSVAMLDQNTAIVSGKGTAFDSAATVQHDTLVRAAKLTVGRGFRYFVVIGAQDQTRHGTMVIPGQTYSSGTATGSATTFGSTTYANANYSGSSYTTPGTAMELIKPGQDITVRMYGENKIAPNTPGLWDARSILAAQPSK